MYIAEKSPLKLNDFVVLDFEFDYISPENDDDEADMDILPVLIDWDYMRDEGDKNEIRVIMVLIVNEGKKIPGYYFKILAGSSFKLIQKGLNETQIKNLLGISAVNMTISNIRGFLRNVSSYGVEGEYLLPAINMQKLLDEKRQTIKMKNKKEETGKME